jgi:hypothetical protein
MMSLDQVVVKLRGCSFSSLAPVKVARFQAIRAKIHAQKRVSVLLPDVVPGELALTEIPLNWG